MTETKDAGMLVTDLLADNQARNIVADKIREIGFDAYSMGSEANPERLAAGLVGSHVVTFEHEVNEHGVPVRRYVMRGDWEVDPQPPVHLPRKGDVVRFRKSFDHDISTQHHGIVPAGSEWIVRAVPYVGHDGYAMIFVAQPDWPIDSFYDATAAALEIVRRPA